MNKTLQSIIRDTFQDIFQRSGQRQHRSAAIGALGSSCTLLFLLPVSLLPVSLLPTSAHAQGGGSNASGNNALEEIIVTARRREESLQEVPVSISVLSNQSLIDAGVVTQDDLFTLVPGLDYDTTQFGTRQGGTPGIRGAQSNQAVTLRQKVMTFVDGVPTSSATGATQMMDAGRVEIYRGPQSSAFGRATFGGAINYVSRDPTDEFSGSVQIETSDLGRNNISAQLAGPIPINPDYGTLGYTLDWMKDSFDGPDEWVSSDGQRLNQEESDYIAAKLVYAPTDSFELKLRYSRHEFDDKDVARYFITPEAYAACVEPIPGASPNATGSVDGQWVRGSFDCDVSISAGQIPRNQDATRGIAEQAAALGLSAEETAALIAQASQFSYVPFEKRTRESYIALGSYEFGNGSAIEVSLATKEENGTSWRSTTLTDRTINVVGPAPGMLALGFGGAPVGVGGFRAFTDPHEEDFAELRFVSPQEERLRYLVGASYFSYFQHLRVYGANYNGFELGLIPAASELQNLQEEGDNVGVFGSVQYDLTEKLTLSLEGRYQEEELTSTIVTNGVSFDTTTEVFLPRLSLTYNFSDNLTGYLQYAEGNSPAGVNAQAADPSKIAAWQDAYDQGAVQWNLADFLSAPEEEIENYEIGLKGTLFDNRVQFSASVYTYDWSNYNIPLFLNFRPDLLIPGGQVNLPPFDYFIALSLYNEGNVEAQGAEFEASYLLNDNWSLSGALSLQDAEFKNHCSIPAVSEIGFEPTSSPQIDGAVIACREVGGNKVPRVPEWSGSLSVTYQAPLFDTGWDLMTRVDYRYRGKQPIDTMNLANYPDVHWVNLNVAFTREHFDVRFYVNNLTDDDSPINIQSGTDNNQIPGKQNFNVVPRLPRETGVRLAYKF